MELKDLIKNRRIAIGKTLEDVGKEVGVSKATVLRWENGELKDMRRDKIVALARALDTTPAYLMGWEEQPESIQQDQLSNVYFRFAKEAQDNNIDPEDIRMAIDTIKKIRGQ